MNYKSTLTRTNIECIFYIRAWAAATPDELSVFLARVIKHYRVSKASTHSAIWSVGLPSCCVPLQVPIKQSCLPEKNNPIRSGHAPRTTNRIRQNQQDVNVAPTRA